MNKKLLQQEKNLIKRYLVWCYKTTKEELDKIDRKFTQLMVDRIVLKELNKKKGKYKNIENHIRQFEDYIVKKERSGIGQKFLDTNCTRINPNYAYLKARLEAVEKSAKYFLGAKHLEAIKQLYEKEMVERILKAREHT